MRGRNKEKAFLLIAAIGASLGCLIFGMRCSVHCFDYNNGVCFGKCKHCTTTEPFMVTLAWTWLVVVGVLSMNMSFDGNIALHLDFSP